MVRSLVVIPLAVAALVWPDLASAQSPPSPHGIKACRTQAVTWTKGHKPALSLNKGPRQRSRDGATQKLTDGAVSASYGPVDQAKFLDIEAVYPATQPQVFTRLKSVTVYPVRGKKKTWKPSTNANKNYVYKFDLLKGFEQVQLPVSGSTAQGRPTPKLKKVVVTATEACYSIPEPAAAARRATVRSPMAASQCRTQTITYANRKGNRISMNKGPTTRTKVPGQQTQDDTRVIARYTSNTIGGDRPSYYFEVGLDTPSDGKYTRLTAVTVYPKHGKKKTFKTTPGDQFQKNKYALDYHHTVVLLPVNKNESGRKNPAEQKVVVTAREGCYSKQQT